MATACPLATSSCFWESLTLLREFTAAQPSDLWGGAAAWRLVCVYEMVGLGEGVGGHRRGDSCLLEFSVRGMNGVLESV